MLGNTSRHHAIHFRLRPGMPDPDDEFVPELAFVSRCDFIVTHNVRDLRDAERFGRSRHRANSRGQWESSHEQNHFSPKDLLRKAEKFAAIECLPVEEIVSAKLPEQFSGLE